MIKKINAIIFVERNKILFYYKGSTSTLQLNLGPDVIEDLEIINREKLEHLLNNLFQSPNIKGKEFDVTVIFSQSATFEKDLTNVNSKAEFDETQRFLDMVPFEEILNNSYRINKKTKIVAANKIFYNIIKQILEKNNAEVILVLPMAVLVNAIPDLKNKIDFSLIESKQESLKQYSLIDLVEMGLGGEVTNSIGIKRKDVRLYLLILVMIGLFLILIYMVYATFIALPKKNIAPINSNIVPTVMPIITPQATDSAEISTKSSALEK